MSNGRINAILMSYQKARRAGKARRDYLRRFEKKMLYRTTKTENPETTMAMVNRVLRKLRTRASLHEKKKAR